MPAKGFEPLTPYGEQFLRLPRIPFRHAGLCVAATVYAMGAGRRKPAHPATLVAIRRAPSTIRRGRGTRFMAVERRFPRRAARFAADGLAARTCLPLGPRLQYPYPQGARHASGFSPLTTGDTPITLDAPADEASRDP